MKVNILLSTYNGEKYLAEQIDSIIGQTYSDWTLLIRDDGSQDGTAEIIDRYTAKDTRVRFINPNGSSNVGVHRSFKELAAWEEAEWFFFSDQDDVWLPNKIEGMLASAATTDSSTPTLFYSDLTTVTADLTVISRRLRNKRGMYTAPDLKGYLSGSPVPGCTSMFNKALRDLWLEDKEIIGYHDSFCGFLAVAVGRLVFLDESYILYRQHQDNAVGVADTGAISNSIRLFWEYNQAMIERSRNVLTTFPDRLSSNDTRILRDFCAIPTQSWWKRALTLAKYRYKYTLGDWKYTLVVNALLLTQFGRKRTIEPA